MIHIILGELVVDEPYLSSYFILHTLLKAVLLYSLLLQSLRNFVSERQVEVSLHSGLWLVFECLVDFIMFDLRLHLGEDVLQIAVQSFVLLYNHLKAYSVLPT